MIFLIPISFVSVCKQIEAITTLEDWSMPEDLIINEILRRLPVKSLIRFRSVCKALHSAISKRHLIELHRQRSQSKVHLLSHSSLAPHGISSINIKRLTEEGKLQHYYRLPWTRDYRIVNSSHDLIVLSYKDGYLLLNPATQDIVNLPRPSWGGTDFPLTGFGFVSSLGKYKVVSITLDTEDICEVFTVGMDNSWRKGKSPPSSLYAYGHTAYVDGNLHILSLESKGSWNVMAILVFNLEKEAWGVRALPDEPRLYPSPVELREILGLLSFSCCIPNTRIDIWMSRDYANNVWSKDFVIDVTLLGAGMNFVVSRFIFGFPLEVMTDGRILLEMHCGDGKRWFYFDPQDGRSQLAYQKGFSAANYAENLVPILGF